MATHGDYEIGDEGAAAWPAFADLLAASTLIFLVFFAAIAIPALKRAGEAEGRGAAIGLIQAKIDSIGKDQPVRARRIGDYLLIEIEGDATFPVGEYQLSQLADDGRRILREFGEYLKSAGPIESIDQIQVVGHASNEGLPERNWRVSSGRAASVAMFLIETVGLDPCMIAALGRSYYYPRDPDRPQDADAADRRIELEVHPKVVGDGAQAARRAACRPGGVSAANAALR